MNLLKLYLIKCTNEKIYCITFKNFRKFKNHKHHTFSLSSFSNSSFYYFQQVCGSNNNAVFEKEESIETLKILGLINNINE